jgi:hypothetical protein
VTRMVARNCWGVKTLIKLAAGIGLVIYKSLQERAVWKTVRESKVLNDQCLMPSLNNRG